VKTCLKHQRRWKVGEATKAVTDVLHSHFEKEEEYALPPLGLLSSLVAEEQERGTESKITRYKK
jgi:hypothetical protein